MQLYSTCKLNKDFEKRKKKNVHLKMCFKQTFMTLTNEDDKKGKQIESGNHVEMYKRLTRESQQK